MPNDLFGTNGPSADEIFRTVEEAQREVRYFITDMPVELIKNKFNKESESLGDIYIPEYQRSLRWDERAMSFFIESILLRIPIPPVFFYENLGRLEVVDGSQRIRTLIQFVTNSFSLSGLEKLDILNGMRFEDIPPVTRKKFLNTPIRTFTLEQDTDGSTRYEMFRRINTSAKKLDDAEIRKGAFQGIFLDLVASCADSNEFRRLINTTTALKRNKRDEFVERQELVTRYFIYINHYKEFTHDVRKFLDEKFQLYNQKLNDEEVSAMKNEFFEMCYFFQSYLPNGFRKSKDSTIAPRVRFEALSVGASLALRMNKNLTPGAFDWINQEPFTSLVRTDASNSGPKLRARIEYVRDKLSITK